MKKKLSKSEAGKLAWSDTQKAQQRKAKMRSKQIARNHPWRAKHDYNRDVWYNENYKDVV